MSVLLDIVGRIETNNYGRVVLGITADTLHDAYGVLDRAPSDGREAYLASARSLLDVVNAYAQGIYAVVPANDDPINDDTAARVRLALTEAEDAFNSIGTTESEMRALTKGWAASMAQALPDLGGVIGNTIAGVVKAPAEALTALLWPVAIVAAVVLVFMTIGKRAVPA